ncbi:MAG TPA: DNA primase [Motilibacterales bacterium]|nr:DNA primase [Motilibacterales bacterium]
MVGRVRTEDVALVRERVRVDAVIGEVVTLRSAGAGSLKGLCPFHDERSPSFHVTPARGLYYCFGCGEGGDVVDFLMKHDHLTFTEAIEKLADRAGVTLRYEDGVGPSRTGPNRQRLAQANRIAAAFYERALSSPEAALGRQFLSERGFDGEACEHFGVGFAPKSWDALLGHLRSAGFTDAESLAAGLVSQGGRGTYDRFRGRLVWPIRDAAGDVLGFGARKLFDDDEGPKYLNTPETALYKKSHVLYGIDLARRDIGKLKQVVVVEGYTDVMAAHLAGVTTAVATCGTAFGPDHAALLRRYLVDDDTFGGEVIFTFDGDAAGQKAALRAFEGDQRFVAQTFVAISPDNMDPCELRLASGDAAVRELVAARTPLFAFAIRSAVAGFDLTTAEGRVAAVRKAAPLVARIRDAALRPEYSRLLSGWVGVPERDVRAAVTAAGRAGATAGRGSVSPGRAGDGRGGERQGDRSRSSAVAADGRPGSAAGSGVGSGAPGDDGSGGGRDGSGDARTQRATEGSPERAPRPNPRDPGLFVEREALKCVLQVPDRVGDWFDSVQAGSFRHPRYAEVHQALASAGGSGGRTGGQQWMDAVLSACPDDLVRDLVRELAVEPLVTSGEPTSRYATSIVARLLSDEAGRRLADLKRELGQLDQIWQADQAAAVFVDVMALEAYRRELAQVGQAED